jgi:hypothetical protein
MKAFTVFWLALLTHSDRNCPQQKKQKNKEGLSNSPQKGKNILGQWVQAYNFLGGLIEFCCTNLSPDPYLSPLSTIVWAGFASDSAPPVSPSTVNVLLELLLLSVLPPLPVPAHVRK